MIRLTISFLTGQIYTLLAFSEYTVTFMALTRHTGKIQLFGHWDKLQKYEENFEVVCSLVNYYILLMHTHTHTNALTNAQSITEFGLNVVGVTGATI